MAFVLGRNAGAEPLRLNLMKDFMLAEEERGSNKKKVNHKRRGESFN